MNTILNFIDKHMEMLLSIRTWTIVFLIVYVIVLSVGVNHVLNCNDIARQYIHELEEYIERDGTVVGDVIGSDAYSDYYSY